MHIVTITITITTVIPKHIVQALHQHKPPHMRNIPTLSCFVLLHDFESCCTLLLLPLLDGVFVISIVIACDGLSVVSTATAPLLFPEVVVIVVSGILPGGNVCCPTIVRYELLGI